MTTEEAIKVLEDEHRIIDSRNFDRCAKINLALDMAIRALRREIYKEEKKEKKKEKKKDKKKEKKKEKNEKAEYPCKQCVYGTYMSVECMWWCSRYLMYGPQVAVNHLDAKCLKGVTNDRN